jgi:Zn-dependent peptidase ImmA (M78 family)/DNA-binding XRE family transcriptional regulator
MSREFQRERLTAIREARGISMHQLARQLNISSSAVQSWESGKALPREEYLVQLPEIFQVPNHYFFSPISLTSTRLSKTFFRSRASALVAQKKMAQRRIEWLAELVDLVASYVTLPSVSIDSIAAGERCDYSGKEIEDLALATRRKMGLQGNGPIENLTRLCEASGIIVSKFTIANSLDAFSTWIDLEGEKRPLILVDTIKDSPGRLRFNIAHELGHIILHRSLSRMCGENQLHKEIERQADLFASAFLMPKSSFKERVHAHGTSLEDIFNLKREWRTSMQAIIYRMTDLSIINSEYNIKLNKKISYLGFRKKEPGDEYIPFEEPELFTLAFKVMEESGVNIVEYLKSNLQLFPSDINDLIGKRFFEEVIEEGISGKIIPIEQLRRMKK